MLFWHVGQRREENGNVWRFRDGFVGLRRIHKPPPSASTGCESGAGTRFAGWRGGLFLAYEAASEMLHLVDKVFLLLVGELHVLEGIGGRGDEMLDFVLVFGC